MHQGGSEGLVSLPGGGWLVDGDAADSVLQLIKLNPPRPAFIGDKEGQVRAEPLRPLHRDDAGLLQKLRQGDGLGRTGASRQAVQVHVPERPTRKGMRLNEGKGRAGHFRRVEAESRGQTFHELRFPAAKLPAQQHHPPCGVRPRRQALTQAVAHGKCLLRAVAEVGLLVHRTDHRKKKTGQAVCLPRR